MKKCAYDPMLLKGMPIGMFHCPECDEMVIAGLSHYPEESAHLTLDRAKSVGKLRGFIKKIISKVWMSYNKSL